ncbi:MAG: hypothetical protein KDA58_00155 [Planctomycetaceae bacterium]|nr:hypothetical protein [Planctomycetaceae bacterium]
MFGWKYRPEQLRYVDMWMFPNMHPTNVDLLQRLKSADDRQFGTGMDVCGTVADHDLKTGKWNTTHLVGVRSDIWAPDEEELQKTVNSLQRERKEQLRKSIRSSGRMNATQRELLTHKLQDDAIMQMQPGDVEKRRMVLKLFRSTGERLRWVGTIEELTAWEISNSLGSKRTLLSLAVILPDYDYVTIVQQTHRTFRIPSVFACCFHDTRNDRVWHIHLKRKWVSIGADYIIEADGQPVGKIDGNLIGLGYNAYLELTEPLLAENRQFIDLLSLFATSISYHRAMRKSISRRVKSVRGGTNWKHVIEDEELRLMQNPRRRAA